jgi:nucleoside phosphorylase
LAKLLVFPLKKELQYFSETLTDLQKVSGFSNPVYFSKTLNCYLAIGGYGKVQFAISITEFISKKNFSKILALGACGSLRSEIPIGTAIMAEKVYEHDLKPQFVKTTPEALFLHTFQLQHPHLVRGIVASGDEDIVEEIRAQQLREFYQADAVTWESAGGAKAAGRLHQCYAELRVVTDHCCANASKDFNANLQTGMQQLFKLFCLLKESSEW